MSVATAISTNATRQEWATWAEEEFRGAGLGDARLDRRLVQIVAARMTAPAESIPRSLGPWAQTKAGYRFMDNDSVAPSAIYARHRSNVVERASKESVVLAVADTTMLDFTSHPGTQGLGPLADEDHHGLVAQPTLVVTPTRVPLGLIDQQVWVRDLETFAQGDKKERAKRPIAQKESVKWLVSLRAADRLAVELSSGGTLVVGVFDREGDVFEVLAEATRPEVRARLVVRSMSNRRVEGSEGYLWEQAAAAPLAGSMTVNVSQKPGRAPREATLEVRFGTVTLRPPAGKAHLSAEPVIVQFVYVHEPNPPTNTEPLSWMLLTTAPVASFDDACTIVDWYAARWTVEVFFRTLKSGCKVEKRQFETRERLERYLAIDSVIAWRVLYLTAIGRQTPDLPCSVVFEEHEWKSLWTFVKRSPAAVPTEVPTLNEAIRMVGRLGGHLGRKSDGEPGAMCMWRGLQRLSDIGAMWLIVRRRE